MRQTRAFRIVKQLIGEIYHQLLHNLVQHPLLKLGGFTQSPFISFPLIWPDDTFIHTDNSPELTIYLWNVAIDAAFLRTLNRYRHRSSMGKWETPTKRERGWGEDGKKKLLVVVTLTDISCRRSFLHLAKCPPRARMDHCTGREGSIQGSNERDFDRIRQNTYLCHKNLYEGTAEYRCSPK